MYRSIKWDNGKVVLLDQRALPHRVEYIAYTDYRQLARAITDMVVRGAPAIGDAGAYGVVLACLGAQSTGGASLRDELEDACTFLDAARPTAVNLSWAIRRMRAIIKDGPSEKGPLASALLEEANAILAEDIATNVAIGRNALPLVPLGAKFLHHCNTGALATADYGTALGIIRTAFEAGRCAHAYLDETRPRLQGASLSAWELKELGIPHTVIVDGASGYLMKKIGIDLCVVGCDRVAANGDTANKIGTYNLAIAARAHGVPFYVAAPSSTIDMTMPSGEEIEIEERTPSEITTIGGTVIAPEGTSVWNPAFDVTPADYITALVTEKGVVYPPFTEGLKKLFS